MATGSGLAIGSERARGALGQPGGPDVREAEQRLVAANARVGVAKAAFYPSISLTGIGGIQTAELLNITSRSGAGWSVGGLLDVPVDDPRWVASLVITLHAA